MGEVHVRRQTPFTQNASDLPVKRLRGTAQPPPWGKDPLTVAFCHVSQGVSDTSVTRSLNVELEPRTLLHMSSPESEVCSPTTVINDLTNVLSQKDPKLLLCCACRRR
ncbi:hypothetical protein SRHO_G00338780 [Serrasalmus rhombeus]